METCGFVISTAMYHFGAVDNLIFLKVKDAKLALFTFGLAHYEQNHIYNRINHCACGL